MSSVLGLAGVTATLQDMIANRISEEPLSSALGTVQVTALPPDRVELSDSADPMQVNVFLHQVSRNQGWANQGAPERSRAGQRISAPPMVLDLHYLVTVYAASPLRSEMLLAAVAQTFTVTPVPDRATILAAINPTAPPSGFPAELANCGLEEQFEHLRITPEALSGEEMSKLWSALQARYRPTLGFRVTTVMVDNTAQAATALPAISADLRAVPLRRPEISRIEAEAGTNAPITSASSIVIHGSALNAENLRVVIAGRDLSGAITSASDVSLTVDLSAATFAAGAQTVTVHHQSEVGDPPALRDTVVSNPGIFILRPTVTANFSLSASQVIDGVTYRSGDLTLTLAPDAERSQRITTLLNATDGSGRSYSFTAPPGNGMPDGTDQIDTVVVPVSDVAAGTYLLRVQVDAGESALTQASDGSFNAPTVNV